MNLSVGIVGLPNAGKSTLFNALLKKQIADTAPYPFCTIEPNKGIVEVPDGRLRVLADIVKTEKIIPAAIEFVDIAGLVRGASVGEGLGNKFLANIREVSMICHVVRFFDDKDVAHVEGRLDPVSDVEIINSELILADLDTLEKQKPPRVMNSKEEKVRWQAIKKLKQELNSGKLASQVELTNEESALIKPLFLLTDKPTVYIANTNEEKLKQGITNSDFPFQPSIVLSAKMESDLASLSTKDQEEYLGEYSLTEPGLDRLIKTAYDTLGLISFLTAGAKEVRAWTIQKGENAKIAAGAIHTDFEKNFIKANTVSFEDFVQHQGWLRAKEQGRVRVEGKDYIVKDGDVIEFKIGACQ